MKAPSPRRRDRRKRLPNRDCRIVIDAQDLQTREKYKAMSHRELGRMFHEVNEAVLNGDRDNPILDQSFIRRIVWGASPRPHIPLEVRRAVFERDRYACVECASVDDLSLDHIIPFIDDGLDTEENLRVLCMPCNRKRGNRR